jgi:hypothetical protein
VIFTLSKSFTVVEVNPNYNYLKVSNNNYQSEIFFVGNRFSVNTSDGKIVMSTDPKTLGKVVSTRFTDKPPSQPK